jgi:hypothetical protein
MPEVSFIPCAIALLVKLTRLPVTGWIPLMLPFGFADSLSSTLDIPTLWDTVYVSAREMIGNLLAGKI